VNLKEGGSERKRTNGNCCKNRVHTKKKLEFPLLFALSYSYLLIGGKIPHPLSHFFRFLSSLIYDDRLMANIDFALKWKCVWACMNEESHWNEIECERKRERKKRSEEYLLSLSNLTLLLWCKSHASCLRKSLSLQYNVLYCSFFCSK
jgi:hypothetical protein